MKLTKVLRSGVAALAAFVMVGVIVEAVLVYVAAFHAAAIHQTVDANWTLFISVPLGVVAAILAAIATSKP